ncbi:MAG: hypothetical protein JO291_06245 [Acidimicrobiia bacterium]|nr:hypothetical protein [Acidimicrobiia bacterium]
MAPAGAFHTDPLADALAVGYDGTARVLVHGTIDGGLTFDRFTGTSGPIGRPTTVEAFEHPDTSYRNWHDGSVAYGDGYAISTFDAAEPSGQGFEIHHRVFDMIGPSGTPVPSFLEPGGGGFTICPDDHDPTAPGTEADDALAWNGSTFVVAKACEDGLRVFTLDTTGNATAQAAGPGVTGGIALASVGGGSLVVWSQGAVGSRDIRALRLDVDGLAVGSPFTVAGGPADQTDPVVAASSTGYLVGWSVPDHNGDLAVRTVSGTGALGASHTLVNEGHKQFGLQFAPGGGGTWFSAWADGRSPANNERAVYGTKLSAAGVPTQVGGRVLVASTGQFVPDPGLAPGPDGTAVLSWLRVHEGASRRLDTSGQPVGAVTEVGRAPVPQSCVDVAAGSGQYLVTWHETRVIGDTKVFAQRYTAAGVRTGPVIALAAAHSDQFCPRAAWNGTNWLVAWTDHRNDAGDVYGTRVSGTGAVLDPGGIRISGAAGSQQSPVVAADGARFVVAWNDGRNGNQDIFAARVAANGAVLDPGGKAVTTAAGLQRQPVIASTGGSTVIAWLSSNDDVERRILRTDGTFLGGVGVLGKDYAGTFGFLTAAAGGGHLGVAWGDEHAQTSRLLLAQIAPATGAVTARTVLDPLSGNATAFDADLSYDGTRFMFTEARSDTRVLGTSNFVGLFEGEVLKSGLPEPAFNEAEIASLPDGTSLVVSSAGFAPTITTVAVNDDGV